MMPPLLLKERGFLFALKRTEYIVQVQRGAATTLISSEGKGGGAASHLLKGVGIPIVLSSLTRKEYIVQVQRGVATRPHLLKGEGGGATSTPLKGEGIPSPFEEKALEDNAKEGWRHHPIALKAKGVAPSRIFIKGRG